MKPIRNSAKAIIIRDGHLLATRNAYGDDDWYLLPGGGQQKGETLKETLQRECQEEIGASVRIGSLKFIREYIGKNHEFPEHDGDVHQVEFMFECEVDSGYVPQNGPAADTYQTGVSWIRVSDLQQYRLYPGVLKTILVNGLANTPVTYLGDVN